MDEQKTTTEETTTETNADTSTGDNSQTSTILDRADSAAKRLEEANKKTEDLLRRQEELEARRRLGGKSEGGFEEEKKGLSDAEYAQAVLSGKLPQ